MEWIERHRNGITLALLVALALGAALWWERRPPSQALVITSPAEQADDRERWITVDVAGAVARPGIYTLRAGSRVTDAIAAAGGETADADLTGINRAQKLRDEQQIRVPRLRAGTTTATLPTPGGSPTRTPLQDEGGPSAADLLDINTASLAELDTLPGIGPVTAQRIAAYREQHGLFTSVEQLKEAKLVNSSTFEKIKDLIKVQ